MSNNIPAYLSLPFDSAQWPEQQKILKNKIYDAMDVDNILKQLNPDNSKTKLNLLSGLMYNYNRLQRNKMPEKLIIGEVLPNIANLAAESSSFIVAPIAIDAPRQEFSRVAVAAILALSFFGLVKSDQTNQSLLSILEQGNVFAFEAIMHYFYRIMLRQLSGNIIVCKQQATTINWSECPLMPAKAFIVQDDADRSRYEYTQSALHIVDCEETPTAGIYNTTIGTKKRETMLFFTNPELLIIDLTTSKIAQDEVVAVMGAEMFSQYKLPSYEYVGGVNDYAERFANGTIARVHVFADSTTVVEDSELTDNFDRDLAKLGAAISIFDLSKFPCDSSIVDWRWGKLHKCNSQIKYFQLLLAASIARVNLIYFYDGSAGKPSQIIKNTIDNIVAFNKRVFVEGMTAGDLYNLHKQLEEKINRDIVNNYNVIDYDNFNYLPELMSELL